MKAASKQVIIVTGALLLGACASTPDYYRPAGEDGGYGYSEVRLTDDRFRVSFNGDASAGETVVKDLALMRAAELTLDQGHDWFRIVTEENEQTTRTITPRSAAVSEGQEITQECGPGGCTTTISPAYTGVEVVTLREADRFATTFEIVMGSGEVVDPTVVYDADELYENLEERYDG